MKYNINDKRMLYISTFSDIPLLETDIHFASYYIENKIVFLPSKAGVIHIYNIIDSTFEKILIPVMVHGTCVLLRNIPCYKGSEYSG